MLESGRSDSNRRPPVSETGATTTALLPLSSAGILAEKRNARKRLIGFEPMSPGLAAQCDNRCATASSEPEYFSGKEKCSKAVDRIRTDVLHLAKMARQPLRYNRL